MNEPSQSRRRKSFAVLKVLYVMAVTAVVFAIPAIEVTRPHRFWAIPGLLLIQAAILIAFGTKLREVFRPLGRLKWLFIVLLACYAFLPSDDERNPADWHAVQLFDWMLWVNLGGIAIALIMCLQILTVLLASTILRVTGSGTDLVIGLRSLGFPKLFVYSLNLVLAKLEGARRPGMGAGDGKGGGRGGRRHVSADPTRPGFFSVVKNLMRGDVTAFTAAIRYALDDALRQVEEETDEPLDRRFSSDVAVIAGVGLVMVGFKMLKLLPGIPIASGHKTLLLFPLYILASRLTYSRWGGTIAGSVMGIVGFLQGDGRFGIPEVLKHIAPGLFIDLMMPVLGRLPERAWVYCTLGFLAGIARLAMELAVLLLLGTRAEVYLFMSLKLIPTLIPAVLSGFVAVAILRAFPADRLPGGTEKIPTSAVKKIVSTKDESEIIEKEDE